MLSVDVVFHPSWWYKHEGLIFDEDFFYNPLKRVESEQLMEQALYNRFGQYGLGKNRLTKRPEVGAVHLAAGYLLSELMGCHVEYLPDSAPIVHVQNASLEPIAPHHITTHKRWKDLIQLIESLQLTYGYVTGDIDWGGILNLALDIRGNAIFFDFFDTPDEVDQFFRSIAETIDYFTHYIKSYTGTTSISVNRSIIHYNEVLFLHSECAHTMISNEHYQQFLFDYDRNWSIKHRPFGIHYCGNDPHRFAAKFSQIPHLDFLDIGWGGDVSILRKHLPHTFFNIRLNPSEIAQWSENQMYEIVNRLVTESGDYNQTGICCINMDADVPDEKVLTLLQIVESLRKEQQ